LGTNALLAGDNSIAGNRNAPKRRKSARQYDKNYINLASRVLTDKMKQHRNMHCAMQCRLQLEWNSKMFGAISRYLCCIQNYPQKNFTRTINEVKHQKRTMFAVATTTNNNNNNT
jgi:hypothetical protein